MSLWLINLFMNKVVKEMKARVDARVVRIDNTKWKLNTVAKDTVSLVESEKIYKIGK